MRRIGWLAIPPLAGEFTNHQSRQIRQLAEKADDGKRIPIRELSSRSVRQMEVCDTSKANDRYPGMEVCDTSIIFCYEIHISSYYRYRVALHRLP